MNNSRESEEIYQIYQEGIFDRVGARIKGVGNTKFFGGTGYNAGKAESFKGKFYARIIKDIDKFLKEVQTMGNLRSLAEFEEKYPDMARKIACMADAVGHTTQLTVKCDRADDNLKGPDDVKPYPIDPEPVEPESVEPEPPKPGLKKGYICVNGVCKSIPAAEKNGKLTAPNTKGVIYRTEAECKAKCAKPKKPDPSKPKPLPVKPDPSKPKPKPKPKPKKPKPPELEAGGGNSKKAKADKIMKETKEIIVKIAGNGNNININFGNQEEVNQIINNKQIRSEVSASITKTGIKSTKSNIDNAIKATVNKLSKTAMAKMNKTRKKMQSTPRFTP